MNYNDFNNYYGYLKRKNNDNNVSQSYELFKKKLKNYFNFNFSSRNISLTKIHPTDMINFKNNKYSIKLNSNEGIMTFACYSENGRNFFIFEVNDEKEIIVISLNNANIVYDNLKSYTDLTHFLNYYGIKNIYALTTTFRGKNTLNNIIK